MKRLSEVRRELRARRRVAVLSVTLGAALAASAGALAWHGFSSASIVSATFTAATVTNSQSSTCSAANNDSIQVTDATFSGTAVSADPHLNGPITINARSVYDATTKAGTVSGWVSINGASGSSFQGRMITVDVNGQLQGLLAGEENNAGPLVGNVSSIFSTTAGFGTSSNVATIGSGTGTNTAIVSTSSCQPQSTNGKHDDQNDDNGKGDSGGQGNFTGSGQFGNLSKVSGAGDHHSQQGGNNQD